MPPGQHHTILGAERIMSIINLGLQCVGIMRKEMTPETEASIASCNNMAQLRKVGESKPDLVQDSIDRACQDSTH